MNYQLLMSRKQMLFFNELEFRRMAEQFDAIFKKAEPQQLILLTKKLNYTKAPAEKRTILLQVLYLMTIQMKHVNITTLENTEHSD
jgi:DNA polymerase-1